MLSKDLSLQKAMQGEVIVVVAAVVVAAAAVVVIAVAVLFAERSQMVLKVS